MAKVSKRLAALKASVDRNKLYSADEALALVKGAATAKFDESIDVAVNLGEHGNTHALTSATWQYHRTTNDLVRFTWVNT